MKYLDQRRSSGGKTVQGWSKQLVIWCLSAVFCFSLYHPTSAAAQTGPAVTQLDFIKWLVQLTGDTPLFDSRSTTGDYIYWAKKYKMDPKGGWRPTEALSQGVFAELLVDFYKIKGQKGDEIRTLEREGIFIPNEQLITQAGLVSVVDDFGFQSRLNVFSHNTCSPITGKKHKITIKECTPPPPPVGSGKKKRKFHSFKEKKQSKHH